jgi:AmiR/NasT family two-component response regulator
MMKTASLLAADRAMDQAWRGGVGVAKAVTQAQELTEALRRDRVMEDAKAIVSDRHCCSPDESFARIVFVSQRTNRRVRDIAGEVIAAAAVDGQGPAVPPRRYRFTL